MNQHTSKFELNESYWKEFFYQSYLHGDVKGKIASSIGILFLIAGIVMLFTNIPVYAPIILIVIGVYESFGLPIKFRVWKFRNGLKAKYDDELQFLFEEDGLYHKGKTSEGKTQWSGVLKWVETPKGFLLWPHKKIQLYIPKSSMNTDTATYLREVCLTKCAS